MAEADYGLEYFKLAPATEKDLSGYYQCDSTTEGALKVVASGASTGEINKSSVTPYRSKKPLAVNDYVIQVTQEVGSFIDFETIKGLPTFNVTAIVKDSFSYADTAPTEENIEIEDSDDYFATIKTDGGSQGFTLQTYDMGQEAYEYLMGYEENDGWIEEPVNFELPNQCVQLKTRKLGGFPSKLYEYARMSVRVSRTGTIGKSGFPNFQLEFTKLANYDEDGVEIAGARWKKLSE